MIKTKCCTICKKCKPLSEFYKRSAAKDGHQSECKKCSSNRARKNYSKNKEDISNKHKEYYLKNKEEIARNKKEKRAKYGDDIREKEAKYRKLKSNKIRAYQKEYYQRDYVKRRRLEYQRNNKDKCAKYRAKYRATHKKQIAEYSKKYRENNRDKINAAALHRLHNDPIHKLKEQTRNMLRYAFRSKGHRKTSTTKDILGCDLDFFCQYMFATWEKRYGRKWSGEPYHIDHIIPLATASSEEEIKKLCHYTNLQMLTPEDNFNKSDKLDWR